MSKRSMGHWSKNRVQICTDKRRRCAECKRVRLLKYFYTSSKNLTRVCDKCRDDHDTKVGKIKVSTAINAPSMDDPAECEKCGARMELRKMSEHRKTCILGRLYDIPGIRPPGQYVEDELAP